MPLLSFSIPLIYQLCGLVSIANRASPRALPCCNTGLQQRLVIIINSNMIRKNHGWWFCAPAQCYRYTDPPGELVKGLVPQSIHFVPLIPPKCRRYPQKCQDVLYLAPWLHKSSQINKKNQTTEWYSTDKTMSTEADGLQEDKMFFYFQWIMKSLTFTQYPQFRHPTQC